MNWKGFSQMLRRWISWKERIGRPGDCALVLSGGGARSAYQAGVLHYIAEAFPDRAFTIMTGVSAGAINAAQLANHTGTFPEAAARLVQTWRAVRLEDVMEPESRWKVLRTLLRRARSNGERPLPEDTLRGLVDNAPLRAFLKRHLQTTDGRLHGVAFNLKRGTLRAFAVTTTNYSTGQSVTWVEGRDIQDWERPDRRGVQTELTVEHILASASLPLVFPAIKLGDAWYGDGGISLLTPLAPAIHLGADAMLAISTRYKRSQTEGDAHDVTGYPPAAQILGLMLNAIFLDTFDQDAAMLERINRLVKKLPPHRRDGLRPIRLLILRPSVDLGKLAAGYRPPFKGALRFLTWGLGATETKTPDSLSMMLFDPDYIARLLEIGYEDARRQHDRIAAFLESAPRRPPGNGHPEAAPSVSAAEAPPAAR
ncbi:Patatin [Rhodothermus marinus SG0.5JP17-172]|nr:Patatin [Rhodothermus marinus SG0.5JP17-172]